VGDSAPRRHALHIPRTDQAFIADALPMLYQLSDHVSHGVDSPVGMPGKAGG